MWGSFLAAAGVALGAYSAHGLEKALIALSYEDSLEQRMEWFRRGMDTGDPAQCDTFARAR